MSVYIHHYISTDTGEIIPLEFIESMRFDNQTEDATIDKLKGDISISIRTISGKEYVISMNSYQKQYKQYNQPNDELATAIYEKWIWIHKPN